LQLQALDPMVAIISSGVSSPSQLPANLKKSSGHSSLSFALIKFATHLDRDFPEIFMTSSVAN